MLPEWTARVDASNMNVKFRGSKIVREDSELPLGSSGLEGIDHEKQADRLAAGVAEPLGIEDLVALSGSPRRTGLFCEIIPPPERMRAHL